MTSRLILGVCIKNVSILKNCKVTNPINPKAILSDLHRNAYLKGPLARTGKQNNHLSVCDTLSRCLHTKAPKTPDLIYIPHIMRWLKTKFRFKLLQKTWDPEFTEGSFIYGTSRAICKVTEIIQENRLDELNELLTASALIKLKDDLATKLSKTQKLIIQIKPEDIKILVPMAVTLNKDGVHKNCRVAMRVLALKWALQNNGALRLVLVALQTEFLRDYTPCSATDWTISAFDVLECTVLAKT